MAGGLRLNNSDRITPPGFLGPSRWLPFLRKLVLASVVVGAFVGYAGYVKLTTDGTDEDASFVHSPGFIRFAQSSRLVGLIDQSAGLWGKILKREMADKAPPKKDPVELLREETIEPGAMPMDSGENIIDEPDLTVTEVTEEEIRAAEAAAAEAEAAAAKAAADAAAAATEAARAEVAGLDVTQPPASLPKAESTGCSEIPDVPWWENKTHEKAIQYVAAKHSGNWDPYIYKWENHLTKVLDIYIDEKKAMIKSANVILGGQELADYVAQIEDRIAVLNCLAMKERSAQSPS